MRGSVQGCVNASILWRQQPCHLEHYFIDHLLADGTGNPLATCIHPERFADHVFQIGPAQVFQVFRGNFHCRNVRSAAAGLRYGVPSGWRPGGPSAGNRYGCAFLPGRAGCISPSANILSPVRKAFRSASPRQTGMVPNSRRMRPYKIPCRAHVRPEPCRAPCAAATVHIRWGFPGCGRDWRQ